MRALALLLLAASPALSGAPAPVAFPAGRACVAWRARRRLWFVFASSVVGTNCSLDLAVSRDASRLRLRAEAAVSGFHSGQPRRDERVQEAFSPTTEIVFVSKPYSAADWERLRSGQAGSIDGDLSIMGSSMPVSLPFALAGSGETAVARGELTTTLSALGIPSLDFGGATLVVEDYLELHYQVPLGRLPAD